MTANRTSGERPHPSYTPQSILTTLVLGLAVVISGGCGGGTTGTSPIADRSFKGSISDAAGKPVASTPMTVSEASSGSLLIDSATDSAGGFAMTLPGGVDSYVVEVEGKPSSPIRPLLRAPSALRSKLKLNTLQTPMLESLLEVKVDEATLCPNLELDGDVLRVVASFEPATTCAVEFAVLSSGEPSSSATAQLVGMCQGAGTVLAEGSSSAAGTLSITLPTDRLAECTSLTIVVADSDNEVLIKLD